MLPFRAQKISQLLKFQHGFALVLCGSDCPRVCRPHHRSISGRIPGQQHINSPSLRQRTSNASSDQHGSSEESFRFLALNECRKVRNVRESNAYEHEASKSNEPLPKCRLRFEKYLISCVSTDRPCQKETRILLSPKTLPNWKKLA